mgnify:FL=1
MTKAAGAVRQAGPFHLLYEKLRQSGGCLSFLNTVPCHYFISPLYFDYFTSLSLSFNSIVLPLSASHDWQPFFRSRSSIFCSAAILFSTSAACRLFSLSDSSSRSASSLICDRASRSSGSSSRLTARQKKVFLRPSL